MRLEDLKKAANVGKELEHKLSVQERLSLHNDPHCSVVAENILNTAGRPQDIRFTLDVVDLLEVLDKQIKGLRTLLYELGVYDADPSHAGDILPHAVPEAAWPTVPFPGDAPLDAAPDSGEDSDIPF